MMMSMVMHVVEGWGGRMRDRDSLFSQFTANKILGIRTDKVHVDYAADVVLVGWRGGIVVWL